MRLISGIVLVLMLGCLSPHPAVAQGPLPGKWTIVDEGTKEGPSSWTLQEQTVIQWSNIYSDLGPASDPEKPGTYAITGDDQWRDYQVRVDIRSRDNDAIGLMFRFQDGDNYYRFSMDKQRGYRRLIKKVKGAVVVLAEDAVPYVQDQWYQLKITAQRDRLEVLLDEQTVFDVQDDSLKQGKIALYCWGNAGSEFKNLAITPVASVPSSTLDLQAPEVSILMPTTAKAFETRQAAVTLSGTASDENGVAAVKWETINGESGEAEGTSNWRIPDIPLAAGENQIVVMAIDAAGNKGIKMLTVRYTPAAQTPVASVPSSPAPVPSPAAPSPEAGDTAPAALPLPGADYIIDPGDVLNISVWKDEALTQVVTVLPDGKFAFPLIGEITAQGKTVAQLQTELTTKIERFVPEPEVTVAVQQTGSMMIYVIGKVNGPGRFTINSDVDVLQGLAMAGGFNPFAKRDKVKIFRRTGEHNEIFEFDYDAVSKGDHLEQNIKLHKGDVIVVP